MVSSPIWPLWLWQDLPGASLWESPPHSLGPQRLALHLRAKLDHLKLELEPQQHQRACGRTEGAPASTPSPLGLPGGSTWECDF